MEVAGNYTYDESRIKGGKGEGHGSTPLLKLLVPNYVAGALIGKGGSLMTEMRDKYGGNIRLSANRQVYPGTDERVIVLTGQPSEIADLNLNIMDKVKNVNSKQPMDETRRDKVKVVLTNAAAGLLIGRGGLTIKAIQEESKAKVSICSIEAASFPGERVLTVSGTEDERIEACRQIIEKISSDASNMANTQLKYTDGSDVGMGSFGNRQSDGQKPYAGLGQMGLFNQPNRSKLKAKIEIQMEVPNELVGPILGKGGEVIRDFVQRSGARFKFSDKDEYAPGTTNRTLTITASEMGQAQTAYCLINERVEQLGNQLNIH